MSKILAFAGPLIALAFGANFSIGTGQGASTETRTLKAVLAEMSKKTGVQAVAITLLEGQEISGPNIDSVTAENVEVHLKAIVSKLSVPSKLVRLYLPKGPEWTAEELLEYAKAEANLFRKPIGEAKADSVEILAQSMSRDKAQPSIDALGLRPVYVIALKQGYFGGVWQSTYGEMRLTQRGTQVSGTYSTNDGQITGAVVGNEMRFQWYEQANGTTGTGVVRLSEDAMSFSGPWWNDNEPNQQAGTWTGTRVKGKA